MTTHIDPICGMTVEEDTALQVEREGETFFFCSPHCMQKFESAPVPSDQTASSETASDNAHSCCQHTTAVESRADKPASKYICPMCPGVESDTPSDCPKCGMALEPAMPTVSQARETTIYTCPMHPQVERDQPGDCPICGMALEPKTVHVRAAEDEPDHELIDMSRRFWIGLVLGLPVLFLAMGPMLSIPLHDWTSPRASHWLQFILATPIVLWCGWPFFVRG